ncbi:tetratricopeptide repeat protein, partial [Bosea sp. (in: a-proteobacteria)]|uniref:tetratricopeptide repeat protein n=1 Tax=Bosea sp. (in: a-proteobacteria) TaxID=1871050 RepID=UPI002735B5F8
MRRWRRALAGLLLAGLAFPLSAGAAERDTAYAAYQTGHYRRALSEALKRIEADSKDAAAMTLVGEIYRQGLGVRPDQRVATEWYERAAERGDINAAYALAIALLDTTGPKRDPDRASTLMRRAAEAGHPAANYNLALAWLATGQPDDEARAIKSLEIAAKGGIPDALHALATLARQGRGMPRSDEQAARWMAQAA